MARRPLHPTQDDPVGLSDPQTPFTGDVHHQDVARAAYYRAQARGFAPGHEMDDWLAAERELCGPGQGRD